MTDINPLDDVQDIVSEHMDAIKRCFKRGVKITVMVRTPNLPDRDFMMTDDSLDEVLKMLARRRDTK